MSGGTFDKPFWTPDKGGPMHSSLSVRPYVITLSFSFFWNFNSDKNQETEKMIEKEDFLKKRPSQNEPKIEFSRVFVKFGHCLLL